MARLRTGRTSMRGCLKSTALVVASRWIRYTRRTNGRPARAASCALRIFDAATICMALVIVEVLVIDRIRRRRSLALCIYASRMGSQLTPSFLELICRALYVRSQGWAECLLASNLPQQFRLTRYQEICELLLKF